MQKIKRINLVLIIAVIFILLIQIPLLAPFFRSGFFPTHDGVQVVRIFEAYQSIIYGDFPPRWSAGLLYGHGYPLYIFYGPFTYLVGAFFVALGFSFLNATKIVFILTFLVGAAGAFFLLRNMFGTVSGIIGTILFSLAPYRAVDVYVRGNVAEFLAYSLFPWVLWMNFKLLAEKKFNRWAIFMAVLFAMLVITHNVSAFIYLEFLLVFNLFFIIKSNPQNRIQLLWILIKTGVLSAALSCFYWLPLIYEKQFVQLDKFADYPYDNYYLSLKQIWYTPWNYNGFTEENPMSLQLGQIMLIISILTFILNNFIKTTYRSIINFFAIIMLVYIFLETEASALIWDNITILHYMQFPWRHHIINTVCGAILVGGFFYLLQQLQLYKKLFGKLLITVLLLIVVGLSVKESYSFFKPKKYFEEPGVSETTTWNDEYMPKWVKSKPKHYAADKIMLLQGEGIKSAIEWGYLNKSFTVSSDNSNQIRIAHVYYPGWKALVNKQETTIRYDNEEGLMTINIPKGENNISFKFERTWWRMISEIVSILGLGYLIFYFSRSMKQLRRGVVN